MKTGNPLTGALVLAMCVVGWDGETSPAHAATITTTYVGVVPKASNSIDDFGFFGTAGADLGGDSFTATYTTDESAPGATSQTIGSLSTIDGATTATLQIGSGVLHIGPSSNSETYAYPNVYSNIARNSFYYVWNQLQTGPSDPFLPAPNFYYTAFSHTVQSGESNALNFFYANDNLGHIEQIALPISMVTNTIAGNISPPAPPPPPTTAPEPSTWAMMLIGFGGLGLEMRSRRRRLAGGAGWAKEMLAQRPPRPGVPILLSHVGNAIRISEKGS